MYNLIYLEGQKELPDHCIDAGVSFFIFALIRLLFMKE